MKSGKLTPDQLRKLALKLPLSDAVLKLNSPPQPDREILLPPEAAATMEKHRLLEIRPTTDEAKLNENERLYLAWLQTCRDTWFGVQCITLKLGHDCRYTPDFWALNGEGLRAIDTKHARRGKVHYEDDAIVKVRVAARLYPWIRFVLAWRDGEVWQHRDIKP